MSQCAHNENKPCPLGFIQKECWYYNGQCQLDRSTEMQPCSLCGKVQPTDEMSIDKRNGKMYCRDAESCWKQWDAQYGLRENIELAK